MTHTEEILIGTRWLLKRTLSTKADSEIEFCENGILLEGFVEHNWGIVNGNVVLSYTDGFTIYIGTINGDVITGEARNIKSIIGSWWKFEAIKLANNENLIGTRWLLEKYNSELEDSEIEFYENGIFWDGYTAHKWYTNNGNIVLNYSNGYAIYTGTIRYDKINGEAKDINGVIWTFKAKKLVIDYNLIGTSWLLRHLGRELEGERITFKEKGTVSVLPSKLKLFRWSLINENIVLSYNNGFVNGTGTIRNNIIAGTFTNKNGINWAFKAEKILKEENFVGTRWLLENIDSTQASSVIELCENGILFDGFNEHKWSFLSESIYIRYNNNYLTYKGRISGNLISGVAKNKDGKKWRINAVRLFHEDNLIDACGTLENSHSVLEETEIEFYENGILLDNAIIQNQSIEIGNDIIDLNSDFPTCRGPISSNLRDGTAKNTDDEVYTLKEEKVDIGDNLVNTRWRLRHSLPDEEDTEIVFFANGTFVDISADDGSTFMYWKIKNGNVFFSYNNFSFFTGTIINDTIKGTAKNKDNNTWTFIAEKIIF